VFRPGANLRWGNRRPLASNAEQPSRSTPGCMTVTHCVVPETDPIERFDQVGNFA
jgi:hypothetical protein